jgi:hypothetical protein
MGQSEALLGLVEVGYDVEAVLGEALEDHEREAYGEDAEVRGHAEMAHAPDAVYDVMLEGVCWADDDEDGQLILDQLDQMAGLDNSFVGIDTRDLASALVPPDLAVREKGSGSQPENASCSSLEIRCSMNDHHGWTLLRHAPQCW